MKKLPFSICIITKNNSQTLERCLQSTSNYFDEIVIADTGSSDSTKEIARQHITIRTRSLTLRGTMILWMQETLP